MNRLGDMHDDVRDNAQELLLKLMHPASSPSVSIGMVTPKSSVHRVDNETRLQLWYSCFGRRSA